VYSTCSVWGQENEGVVAHALGKEAVARGWTLIRALPDWPTRGNKWPGLTDQEASYLLRAAPSTDQTQGFFVALFERRPEALAADLAA
jgi:putative methyltransferase